MSSKPTKASSKTENAKSKPKTAPKPPPSPPEQIKKLFNSLCAQIDGGHFANAIKTCDKILRLDSTDADAVQTKVFLLLQTEQYEPALALLDTQEGHRFERAYALYRLQRESEAEDLLESLEEDRGVLHLQAQLNYRDGQYQGSCDIYNELLDTAEPQSEEHSDIVTNLQAAQRQLDFMNSTPSIVPDIENIPPPSLAAPSIPNASLAASAKPGPVPEKKVRTKRVPKGVIPGLTPPPDPERWLKKSERTTFNTGKRKKGGGGATQGSTVDSAPTPTAKSGGGKGKKRK